MAFKIVRNDITKMHVDAIVNTANEAPTFGTGVDTAIYKAAGMDQLLEARKTIGYLAEGDVAWTPAFNLFAKYILHAVSPRYIDGKSGEEEKLRKCYEKSLLVAYEKGCKSIAFPLIATGGFGYPKEEGMCIAVDEISRFLLKCDMMIYLVVFDAKATELALRLQPALNDYIDQHYVSEKYEQEYGQRLFSPRTIAAPEFSVCKNTQPVCESRALFRREEPELVKECQEIGTFDDFDFFVEHEDALNERMQHVTDTFQEYLFYLIEMKGLSNPEVYNRALITKQTFSKIKKNKDYHPDKTTAMRLCVGAKLSLDETKDLLARAGYALSPCDKRDIIFQFFIENKAYDVYSIDIALEQHGLPCFIV